MFYAIYVELTSLCNMACEFCVTKSLKRKRNHIEFSLFTSIIDQIAAGKLTKNIKLEAEGECLLYPKLFEAIKYCKEKNLETSIITNSLVLTNDLYQSLSDSGLGEMHISLHDLTQSSFQYRHANTNINYSSFYENIIKLIDYHLGHKISTNLVISLLFCKEEWISSQLWDLPEIKKNTNDAVKLLSPFLKRMNEITYKNKIKCYLNKKKINSAIKNLTNFSSKMLRITNNVYLNVTPLNPLLSNTDNKLRGPLGNRIKLVERTKGSCCFLSTPMILSDGTFIPCNVNGIEKLAIGKVDANTPLSSIINGEEYKSFVNKFRNKIIDNPVCRRCMGSLRYKDRFLESKRVIRELSTRSLGSSLVFAGKKLIKKIFWDRLSVENKDYINKILKRL